MRRLDASCSTSLIRQHLRSVKMLVNWLSTTYCVNVTRGVDSETAFCQFPTCNYTIFVSLLNRNGIDLTIIAWTFVSVPKMPMSSLFTGIPVVTKIGHRRKINCFDSAVLLFIGLMHFCFYGSIVVWASVLNTQTEVTTVGSVIIHWFGHKRYPIDRIFCVICPLLPFVSQQSIFLVLGSARQWNWWHDWPADLFSCEGYINEQKACTVVVLVCDGFRITWDLRYWSTFGSVAFVTQGESCHCLMFRSSLLLCES